MSVPLNHDHVDLWIARYAPASGLPDESLLSPDELARAASFRFEHLRSFFVFCRASLRRILGQYLATDPATLMFQYGFAGKPVLRDAPHLAFNASHSGDVFVCAVSRDRDLGIDVEQIRPMPDWKSVSRHFFSPSEQRHLAQLPGDARETAFFECWTRKEAIIKTTGEGVNRPLDSFEVAFGPGVAARLLRLDQDCAPPWQVLSFEPATGYIAAVASPQPWKETTTRLKLPQF